jgi:hypothetical protein
MMTGRARACRSSHSFLSASVTLCAVTGITGPAVRDLPMVHVTRYGSGETIAIRPSGAGSQAVCFGQAPPPPMRTENVCRFPWRENTGRSPSGTGSHAMVSTFVLTRSHVMIGTESAPADPSVAGIAIPWK